MIGLVFGAVFKSQMMNLFYGVVERVMGLVQPDEDIVEPEETYDPDTDEEATEIDMPLSRLDPTIPVRLVCGGFGEGNTDLYRALSAPR